MVLTVFGATAGVGKSTIATNVAAAIALGTDRSVLIMDMDTRFGDVATLLGVTPTATIADLARRPAVDAKALDEALLPHESGAQVLSAPLLASDWAEVSPQQIHDVLQVARQRFDIIVLDTPGTFNDLIAIALEVSDRVLVVAGLDSASTRETAQLFDLVEADRYPMDRFRLLVNQIRPTKTIDLADVAQVVGQPVFWAIPFDAEVPRATARGQPVVIAKPGSPAAKQLSGLAAEIAPEFRFAQPRNRGWLARVFRWSGRSRRAA